jgi:hypothetical protein
MLTFERAPKSRTPKFSSSQPIGPNFPGKSGVCTPKRVTTELSNEARPSWPYDGRWIYFRSDRSGSQQIWKVPATEPFQPAVQVSRNGGFEAVESTDGKVLYYMKLGKGLWSIPVAVKKHRFYQTRRAAGGKQPTRAFYYVDEARRSSDNATPLVLFRLADRDREAPHASSRRFAEVDRDT